MSFKSLTRLTLGRLKRGLAKTLTALTLGRLRLDDGTKKEVFVQPGAMVLGGGRAKRPDPLEGNNMAILLTSHSVL